MAKMITKKNSSKKMNLPRKEKMFDLNVKEQAKEYFTLLSEIAKRNLAPAILAKGTMRILDFGKQLSKTDLYPPVDASLSRAERAILSA